MKDTDLRAKSQSAQLPLTGPGFVGAVYDDKRARDPDDSYRLYYFAARAPLKGAAKHVLKAIAHRCDYRTGEPRRSMHVGTLAYEAGLSRSGTQLGIRKLLAAGYIQKVHSEHPGSHEHGDNRYRIVLTPPLRAV